MGGPCYWLALVTAALMAAKASVPYISPCNSVRDNGWCSNCARQNTRRHGQRQAQHHIGATWRMPRTNDGMRAAMCGAVRRMKSGPVVRDLMSRSKRRRARLRRVPRRLLGGMALAARLGIQNKNYLPLLLRKLPTLHKQVLLWS